MEREEASRPNVGFLVYHSKELFAALGRFDSAHVGFDFWYTS